MSPRRPTRLEDIQPGDEVILSQGFGYYRHARCFIVQRITDTQIILADAAQHVWRKNGNVIGDPTGRLLFGGDAERALFLTRRNETERVMANMRQPFTPRGVRAVRALCDNAEAVLREMGEWTDDEEHNNG